MKTIEVVVASDGTSRVETKGFHGAECQHASRFLEAALGRQLNESLTTEFHASACEQNQITEAN